jgi:geranylgeranyl diphosphate synthase type I
VTASALSPNTNDLNSNEPKSQEIVSATLARAALMVAPALDNAIQRLSPSLQPPVHHHLAGGGKRVRAALSLVSAAAAGAAEEVGVLGAVAIELVHNFSLIHDDIIDEDTERRHRSTVWSEYGVGSAIIAGDALATLALQILLDEPTPERVLAARCLVEATQLMIAGQADDMAFESRPSVTVEECLAMESGKTSALLSCAVSLGAILAGAPDATVQALGEFGSHLGTAFQAVDDLLGVWGEPARTGKPVGSDLSQHKKTLPVSFALARTDEGTEELRRLLETELSPRDVERARILLEECGAREETVALADAHLTMALTALDRISLVPGPKSELVAIARFVTERDS